MYPAKKMSHPELGVTTSVKGRIQKDMEDLNEIVGQLSLFAIYAIQQE